MKAWSYSDENRDHRDLQSIRDERHSDEREFREQQRKNDQLHTADDLWHDMNMDGLDEAD